MANKEKVPKLVGRLEEHFKKTLRDKAIVIKPQYDDHEFFSLMGGACPTFITDAESGHRVSLVPLLRKEKSYWLSLVLSFKGSVSDISSISISVFTGNQFENQMEKLFRAEWHQEDIIHGHAQPHWHFHVREKVVGMDDWEQEQKAVTFGATEDEVAPAMKMIHFAMAAQWHDKPSSHIVELKSIDETQLMNWISSSFEYILHQLNYMERKSG